MSEIEQAKIKQFIRDILKTTNDVWKSPDNRRRGQFQAGLGRLDRPRA